jgi:hypothetical protein
LDIARRDLGNSLEKENNFFLLHFNRDIRVVFVCNKELLSLGIVDENNNSVARIAPRGINKCNQRIDD